MTGKRTSPEKAQVIELDSRPTLEEVLLFLCSLKQTDSLDSRILFHFLAQSIKQETKTRHSNWIAFIEAAHAAEDMRAFFQVDLRVSPTGETFAMLTRKQACFLVLYEKMPDTASTENLDHAFSEFLREWRGTLFKESFLVALFLINKLNKTYEEMISEKRKETKEQREKQIELALSKQLKQQGVEVRHQVRCQSGIADIVTSHAIYEVKAELTLHELRHAIAQVLSYRVYINPSANVYVVGRKPVKEEVNIMLARALGVEVIIWEDAEGTHHLPEQLRRGM
jgi:hypothetical protein